MEFRYESALISAKDLRTAAESLEGYLEHLVNFAQTGEYNFPEGFVNLPNDDIITRNVVILRDKLADAALKYVIVIGIGGSNLGAKAVYDALFGYFDPIEDRRYPKMLFADTNDPEFLARFRVFLNQHVSKPEEVVIIAASKSGGTTEMIANLEFILGVLEQHFFDIARRLVLVTDFGSSLWREGSNKKLTMLPIPPKIGGRYSVLSAVGLLPLALISVDIESFRAGAKSALRAALNPDASRNLAALSASASFIHYTRGKNIHDTFFFHPELESLGKWHRQLMAESLGKEEGGKGGIRHIGITPTVSLGSIDLHSLGQLYVAGPRDKFTTFVWNESADRSGVSTERVFPALVPEVKGRSFAEIMKAIYEGVKKTYMRKELPFIEIIMKDISPYSLGEFLQFKMVEMILLGRLLGVNPFDQPDVESYKAETKKLLS